MGSIGNLLKIGWFLMGVVSIRPHSNTGGTLHPGVDARYQKHTRLGHVCEACMRGCAASEKCAS